MADETIPPATAPTTDYRLYAPDRVNLSVDILKPGERIYCFGKNPGENYYHLILEGEVMVKRGDEIFCLTCSVRDGILTTDRLFWQYRSRS